MVVADNVTILGSAGQIISSKAGYGSAGASKQKRAFKGFDAMSGDVISDINTHNMTLRQRSRVLYMAAPLATSAIRTNRTNVAGCGLFLKSRINAGLVGLESDAAAELEKLIEAEFALWATDKYSCDATGVNDFYAMQQLALMSWLMSGDVFAVKKFRDPTDLRPYSLRLHLLEADRICTPRGGEHAKDAPTAVLIDGQPAYASWLSTEGRNGENKIHDGVEVDEDGMVVAYHVCSRYPTQGVYFGEKPTWTRIEAIGTDTGLPNVLHVMDTERPEQYRGVPYLAHVIEPLLQSRRYTESELMAALVESFFTVFVTKEAGEFDGPLEDSVEEYEKVSYSDRELELGPGLTNILEPGEDIKTADPKRPTSGFEGFVRAISMQIGASLEIPSDLLNKSFNKSYSASRAALLEAWKAFRMRRAWFVSDFCKPVYEAWFSEAVARGRIDAPGFFDDALIRSAWLGSEWIGPSQGQLDPLKEANAHKVLIGECLETREQATVELGNGNWDSNIEQLARERRLIDEAGILGKETKDGDIEEKPDEDEDGDEKTAGKGEE
jgi:lambda family phage portal protein